MNVWSRPESDQPKTLNALTPLGTREALIQLMRTAQVPELELNHARSEACPSIRNSWGQGVGCFAGNNAANAD